MVSVNIRIMKEMQGFLLTIQYTHDTGQSYKSRPDHFQFRSSSNNHKHVCISVSRYFTINELVSRRLKRVLNWLLKSSTNHFL